MRPTTNLSLCLPVKNLGDAEGEMNAFLRGHRILAVKKKFVADERAVSSPEPRVRCLSTGRSAAILPLLDFRDCLDMILSI